MTIGGRVRSAALPLLAALGAAVLCGCARFEYRLVEPASAATRIGKEPVTVPYPPLEYSLAGRGDRLAMRVINPTGQSVTLLPGRSYVVDPRGESHPVRGQALGPHSHIPLFLPPLPRRVIGYAYTPYWGYGSLDIGGYPFWGAYQWPYPSAYFYSYQVHTPFEWRWKTGRVRLHLGYQSAGKGFEQDLVFDREQVKR